MLNRPQIKAEARGLIRTAAVSPILVTAIVRLIIFVLDRVSDLVESGSLFYSYTFSREYLDALLSGDPGALAGLLAGSPQSTAATMFFTVLVNLFTIVLQGGYYVYCMGIRQRLHMPCSTLLDGLSVSGKLIWCGILMYIKIFLWSILFFIPGIVAAYRYRFAYYNLLTDPSLTASEAIRLSCFQTRGMKGDLVLLDLSFLGWTLLASGLPNLLSGMGTVMIPVSALLSLLLNLWLMPYMALCDLAYFEEAQTRLGRPPYGMAFNTF